MSTRSPTASAIDWRDPIVIALGVLLAGNLLLLSSALRDGALAETSLSLGVCYAIVLTMVAISRGVTDRDGFKLALSGGLTIALAGAFVAVPTGKYAVFTAAFGVCSLYYGRRVARGR